MINWTEFDVRSASYKLGFEVTRNSRAAQIDSYLSSDSWLFELLQPKIYHEMYSVQNASKTDK